MNKTARPAFVAGLLNGHSPLPGIVTAGQPNAAQFDELARSGVAAVIDLRPPSEPRGFDEPAVVRAAGMEYHNVPVVASTLDSTQFTRVRELLRGRRDGSVLVHCASANRVGALLIPYLVLDEKRTPDEALQVANEVGLRSDELARSAFAYIRGQQDGRSAS